MKKTLQIIEESILLFTDIYNELKEYDFKINIPYINDIYQIERVNKKSLSIKLIKENREYIFNSTLIDKEDDIIRFNNKITCNGEVISNINISVSDMRNIFDIYEINYLQKLDDIYTDKLIFIMKEYYSLIK